MVYNTNMELPVIDHGREPGLEQLVRALRHGDVLALKTCSESHELGVGTAYFNCSRGEVHLSNVAMDMKLPAGVSGEQAVDEVLEYFAGKGLRCKKMRSGGAEWPDELARAIESRGYMAVSRSVYLLKHYQKPVGVHEGLQIVPGRSVYGQLRKFYEAAAKEEYCDSDEVAGQLAGMMIDWLDDPRVEVLVGRLAGEIAGVVCLMSLGQVGVVYDVFTLSRFRGKKIATTLMGRVAEQCSRAQYEHVVLEALAEGGAGGLYEGLGFERVGDYVQYQKAAGEDV